MSTERFIPVQIDPDLCMRCERCLRACKNNAIYFENSSRHIDYIKCKGCLSCIIVCPRNAIVVISVTTLDQVLTCKIDHDKCTFCGECLKEDGSFCPNNLFFVDKINFKEKEIEAVKFKCDEVAKCKGCLKCELKCPEGAIKSIKYSK